MGGQILPAVTIENWPGDYGVSGAKLMDKVRGQVEKSGVEIRYEEVISVSVVVDGGGFVVATDETQHVCNAVIIAVGTEPRPLNEKQLKEVGERPVSYCATCDGALYRDKPVVVIGSGNTAKHEIRYLEGICSKVYHIHHDDPIPKDAEAVFVATKRVPATRFVKNIVELDAEGYVVAREDCKTTLCPGVFVAGDCRTKNVRQLVTAAGDGAMASASALAFLSERKVSKET